MFIKLFILCLIIKKDEYINFLMEPKNESRPMSLSTIQCSYEIGHHFVHRRGNNSYKIKCIKVKF
jgi:hypothetical protein